MAKIRQATDPKEPIHHKKVKKTKALQFRHFLSTCFWFLTGFTFAAACVISFVLFYFQETYKNRVIPGVFIDNFYIGDKNPAQIEKLFSQKNAISSKTVLQLSLNNTPAATISASTLSIAYDTNLAVTQSMILGKTQNIVSNTYTIMNAYMNGLHLHSDSTYNNDTLKAILNPLEKQVHVNAEDALFNVQNNRVITFKQSTEGKTIDFDAVELSIQQKIPAILDGTAPKLITIAVPIKTVQPNITTEKANSFGIVEVIGQGKSMFAHSIPGRIHNVELAASRVNGILVAPGEDFSFDKYLGDVTAATGYDQAYIIQNGKTILGDGGGICQVSTTLFRAILNAGLPITERHAHAYRVGYYEEDGPPGIDATVFYPTVDLKFKNDTGHHILIQNTVDPDTLELTYTLYGTSDRRQVTMTTPIITNQVPAPPDINQDDPTLPKGTVKQVDFAAAGATVKFTRTVVKNGTVLLNDTYVSNYAPWQAIYLHGTQ